jgi:glucan 1,3-beta-glucosidase
MRFLLGRCANPSRSTRYYQPNPKAPTPFVPVAALNDPNFCTDSCSSAGGNCAESAWGMRILNSNDVLIYGMGLYSFFSNYSTACSTFTAGQNCQSRIFSLEGANRNISVYNLNTIGAQQMVTKDGVQMASYKDNVNNFPSCIAVYKSN